MRGLIALLAVALIAGVAWLEFAHVLEQRDHARSERDTAQTEAAGLREAAHLTGQRLAIAAANDAQHFQELTDALKHNQDLRRAVDDRDQRLLVKATCPAVRTGSGTGAAGVADAGPAELAADARSDYFTLRDQLALSQKMILGLQGHIRTLCTTPPTTGAIPQ